MNYAVLILLFMPVYVYNQVQIVIPDCLLIFINDSRYIPDQHWMDSLYWGANEEDLKYKITSWHVKGEKLNTKLEIPQTLPVSSVIRQVILYYCLKSNENDKKHDTVYIYPYCNRDKKEPYIICRYYPLDQFEFTVRKWPVIPIPPQPKPVENYFFMEIEKKSLEKGDPWSSISDEVFNQIAEENNIRIDTLKAIYQKVLLWRISQ